MGAIDCASSVAPITGQNLGVLVRGRVGAAPRNFSRRVLSYHRPTDTMETTRYSSGVSPAKGSGNAMIGGLVVVAVASVFATTADAFESQVWPGTLPAASATISLITPATVEGSGDAGGGWVLINYALSVDRLPTRACYASSQRVYSYAYCSTRAIHEMQRTSLDLNGNVVGRSGESLTYITPRG